MNAGQNPQSVQPIYCAPLWQWNTSGTLPVVTGYPTASGFLPTKSGLLPNDLQQFVGVPLAYYGNPSAPVPPAQIIQWLRYAEDKVEQDTSILLTQTWVASPPTFTTAATTNYGVIPNTTSGFQVRGYDYDLEDNGYDFQFPRAQEEGWMFLTMRYRPVQSVTYGQTPAGSANAATQGVNAIKRLAYIYPLLNEYFCMPPSWNVEDRDFGYVRFVPATNVAMLPLFALQLAFMGFAESVPGAIFVQYTAGLTPFDYQNRFSFMQQYVLAEAALTALMAIQGTINLGADRTKMMIDGLGWEVSYGKSGPFGNLIQQFQAQRDMLNKLALSKVTGPVVSYI